MVGRRPLLGHIVDANRSDELRPTRLTDFTTGPLVPAPASVLRSKAAIPCVVDVARARTLYVLGLEPNRMREAAFAYLYARRAAESVLLVPWELGPINRPRAETDPLYLFSPGRCGSTLLHKILVAANIDSVSEPDIGGALLSRAYAERRIARPLLRWVTRTYARDLVSALAAPGGTLVVKLRSQLCGVVQPMLKHSRERRTIFMTRRFESWAQSVSQAFRFTPELLVDEYRRSVSCYIHLRRHSRCHLLRYEDLTEDPYRAAADLAQFLGRVISRESIDSAMSEPSQRGTQLEQVTARGRARWEAIRDQTYRRWQSTGSAEWCNAVIGY